jgi:hypothetical protein
MDTQSPQPEESESESSRRVGGTFNMYLMRILHKCRQEVVERDTAHVATRNITQDAHLYIVHKTGGSQNKKQHAVGYEYMHIEVNGHQ